MELKFIWIEDYKNIKKTGFNFNHSIEEQFQFIDNEIIISTKLNSSPDKFFKDNITSVTAIVGKNGSGKTNLTEFINYNLAHARNGGLSTYISSKGITILDYFIFVQKNIKIKNEDFLIEKGYNVLYYKDAPLDVDRGELSWHSLEKNKYIYYNPTFDLRAIPVDDNLVNISTTMLVYNDIYKNNKLYSYAIDDKSSVNQLNAFENMEKSRICDFVLNFKNAESYISFLPEKISVKMDTEENNFFLKKRYFYGEELNKGKNEIINRLQNELDTLKSYIIDDYDFKKYFVRKRQNTNTSYYNLPINEKKDIFYKLFFINIFQCFLSNDIVIPSNYFRGFIYNDLQDIDIDDFDLHNQILKLKGLILELIEKSDWYEFDIRLSESESGYVVNKQEQIYKFLGSIEISIKENKVLLNETISLMDKILMNKRIFSYETLGEFSSGQKHLLTLYSRFFWAKKKIIESEIGHYGIVGESIIIFIDEGEVALHPEWQRVFFNKVSRFLSELFHEKKIQLILTTHSPFVLSDIPKDNVIFLDRDEDANSIISTIEMKNTFGANIHDLLANNFFLQNGLIGDFAKNKISITLNWLKIKANELNKSKKNINANFNIDPNIEILAFNSTEEEFSYHKQIIDLIGEPLVKNKLRNMFIEYVDNDTDFLKSELEKAREKVIELEKRINK